MTPLILQDDLVAEMKRLTKGNLYHDPSGEDTEIKVFAQSLPVPETDEDDDPIPYIIVRLVNGNDSGSGDSQNIVQIVIIIGIYDENLNSQGHRDVMNIIQKIYERFARTPSLNNRAVFNGEFKWAAQEDAYYPYFFGACTVSFVIPSIRREDPFS